MKLRIDLCIGENYVHNYFVSLHTKKLIFLADETIRFHKHSNLLKLFI